MKDFIPPETLDIDQCATVIIRKVTDPASDPAEVQFGYTKDIDTSPATANTFTLGDGQNKTYDNVLLGNDYTVVEDVSRAGWQFASLDCSASTGIAAADIQIVGAQVTFDINDEGDILDCTYTNSRRLGTIDQDREDHLNDTAGAFNFTVRWQPVAGTVVTTTPVVSPPGRPGVARTTWSPSRARRLRMTRSRRHGRRQLRTRLRERCEAQLRERRR